MLLQNLLDRSVRFDLSAGAPGGAPVETAKVPSKLPPKLYLDFNSTTPLAFEIQAGLMDLIQNSTDYGNPSSIHWSGRAAKQIMRESRTAFAKAIVCNPLEVLFCSGATEATNTIFHMIARRFETGESDRNQVLVSGVEHPSCLKAAQAAADFGIEVKIIPVFADGRLDMEFLGKNLCAKTALVSVMAANNETGVQFPVAQIAKLARAAGALMHSDMVQMLGKAPIDMQSLDVDYASFSAHKFYALKGVGVLYVKKSAPYKSLMVGGAQERSRRGGTENVLGVAALGMMALRISELSKMVEHMQTLRDQLERQILEKIPGVKVIGQGQPRISNTSTMMIDNVDGETLLMSLDLKGTAVSTGAACSSGNPEPSPVLLAMGLTRKQAQSSLRISLGWTTTRLEIDLFIEQLQAIVERLRRLHAEEDPANLSGNFPEEISEQKLKENNLEMTINDER